MPAPTPASQVNVTDYGREIRWIGQSGVPFQTPLGVPLVNPFVHKQMQFFKQYKVTGVTLEEACIGVLFGNYRPFMDIKEESYSRTRRTRHLVFNPFTIELEKYGRYAGDIGAFSGRTMAGAMGSTLGLITWDISEEKRTSDLVTFRYLTKNRLFGGHFSIRARSAPDGVIFEDDWTTDGGSDMRTEFLPMANLVLMTHPKGFEQIVGEFVDEIRRARASGRPYGGEIGPPSIEQKDREAPMTAKLDTSTFVALGDSLAAGLTNFSLIAVDQRASFPAVMARQMGADFTLPLLQGPGLGEAHGFPGIPVSPPHDLQTTVLAEFPPRKPASNLSVPGLTVADVVTRRPTLPLIDRGDARQTAINFIFGLPGLLDGQAPTSTLLDIAAARQPTLAVVALGSAEALDAATSGDPSRIPDAARFGAQYRQILSALSATAKVVVTTIPDPIDTAHFSTLDAASHVVKLPPPILMGAYGLQPDDRITVNGLIEIGCQLGLKKMAPLGEAHVLRAAVAADISKGVAALNAEIARAAQERGALVYDRAAFVRKVAADGLTIGSRKLTKEFLGGLYSMNGYTPGQTGQAALANELLTLLNRTYGTSFPLVNLESIAAGDPVADYQQPQGPEFTMEDLAAAAASSGPAPVSNGPAPISNGPAPRGKKGRASAPSLPLTLPPGLEQELSVSPEGSYYGDAIRAVHTTDPEEAFYGLTGNLLFGGLAMVDSRLGGTLKIKFSEPQNDVTHFEVTHGAGLMGLDDGRLVAPQFFQLPTFQQLLGDAPGAPCSGDLNLKTGEVTNLTYSLMFMNSALFALVTVNPTFPKVPVTFPGQYGTGAAKFEQRPDGLLDFTFQGTTFVPLSIIGAPARFPLPFFTKSLAFASVPSNGSALHPHIRLSTRAPEASGAPVDVPTNTVREFVASVHNNSFGDDISLTVDDLGGPAAGRSHLAGRVQVQFGAKFDGRVPFVVSVMPPGGQIANLPQTPFAAAFKKPIPNGMYGHNELLKFPMKTYTMDSVSFAADPLDISHGVIDIATGQVVGDLLHRGLITTNWLLAMVMLETRTPRATFQFRGPASFEHGVNGQLVFRYNSGLLIPFPEGFGFPKPDLKSVYAVGPNSRLEPFVRLQAMDVPAATTPAKSGNASRVKASTGDEFSYRYAVGSGKKPTFEYTNHTQNGVFTLRVPTWVGFLNSRTAKSRPGEFDTITLTGLGTWSGDPTGTLHVGTAQICSSPDVPYVTIQIDGGMTSNVNTKPEDAASVLP